MVRFFMDNSDDIGDVRIKMLGIPDVFFAQGQQSELQEESGLDTHCTYLTALIFSQERTHSVSR
jgi:hypothetical protein